MVLISAKPARSLGLVGRVNRLAGRTGTEEKNWRSFKDFWKFFTLFLAHNFKLMTLQSNYALVSFGGPCLLASWASVFKICGKQARVVLKICADRAGRAKRAK